VYLGELTGLVKFISSTNFFKVSEMSLSPDKLESFRTLLNQKINELLEDAGKTVADMTDSKENYPDPTDRASLESDRNFELRMRDRERKLIAKMQEAIKRIDEGEFGVCEVCGGPISEKRLLARPVTTLCIECKTKQEKMEKLKGE
jgi:DnaK suppressor protein